MATKKIEFKKRQLNDIIKMFVKERKSSSYIGKKYSVSCNTIINTIRANGISVELSDRNAVFFTTKQRAVIVKRYAEGLGESTVELGKAFNCSYATIRRVLNEEKVYEPKAPVRNKKLFTECQVQYIVDAHGRNVSANALSKEFNCSDSVIRRVLRTSGVDTSGYGRGIRVTAILNRSHTKTCRALTSKMYKDHKSFINPKGVKNGYHVDHKLPIAVGLRGGLTLLDLAHPCNLQMLTQYENLSKYTKSSITKRELLKAIREWNKANGDPFASVAMELEYSYKYGRYTYISGEYRYFGAKNGKRIESSKSKSN